MHVQYLQHEHQGTVQLLLKPIKTTLNSLKNVKWSMERSMSLDDDESDLESVPLPIQTFLWRQTNPFLGAKIGKLHEASCVTFERVVVQNILHGLSPSLSDAIGSVSRWRFVRAAFPHIVQCCAALLADPSSRIQGSFSGPLVKLLYILHWLLLDSANECCDVDNETNEADIGDIGGHSVRQYAFSVNSIQLFVYLLTPLLDSITEKDIESNFRLESGLKIWQSLWQYQQPEILCFCAPVKQRRGRISFVAVARKTEPASVVQGIYLGDEDKQPLRRLSKMPAQMAGFLPQASLPPPKPPRQDLAVLSSLNAARQLSDKAEQCVNVRTHDLPKSISEYCTSETEAFGEARICMDSRTTRTARKSLSMSNGMNELDDALNFAEEDKSLSETMADTEITEKAPLAQLREICSETSMDSNVQSAQVDQSQSPTAITMSSLSHASKSSSPMVDIGCDETTSTCTIVRRPITNNEIDPLKVFDPLENVSLKSDIYQQAYTDPQEATYMDVAVIRCLLIHHWSENGVHWALKYLLNRLAEMEIYRNTHSSMFRSRANSVPNSPRLKIHGSEADEKLDFLRIQHRPATWDDVQLHDSNISGEQEPTGSSMPKTELDASHKKRHSTTTMSADISIVVPEPFRRKNMASSNSFTKPRSRSVRLDRNRSNPSLASSSDLLCTRDTRSSSINETSIGANELNSKKFFPEALGSASFIEKNGYLSFTALLKAIRLVAERKCAIRICELALSVCENLFNMPSTDYNIFIDDSVSIVLSVYLWLGCLNGCNEGLRSAHGDFLRVKARNIMATMHRINPSCFNEKLTARINEFNTQTLIDTLHSVSGFCRVEISSSMSRSRGSNSSPHRYPGSASSTAEVNSVPSYRNNFNESLRGIEGIIMGIIMKPVITKLMNSMNDLLQPENMSLYQDVRLFVSFIQEQHGNPFRRVGLSALIDGRPPENQNQNATASDTETPNLRKPRRASFLIPLPEIFASERFSRMSSIEDCVEVETKSEENSENGSTRSSFSGLLSSTHTREPASLRRGLFKKREKTSNTDESDMDSSPSTPRNLTCNDDGGIPVGITGISPMLQPHFAKKKSGGKLHFAFNLLKSVRSDNNNDEDGSDSEANDDANSQGTSAANETTERRLSSMPKGPKIYSGVKQAPQYETNEENSGAPVQALLNLPLRKVVNLKGIQEGVRCFSFFLETCRPGAFPDPPLLTALLDLKSPVLGRAALLLECAFFVHRCNKGDWPEWIRSNTARQLSAYGYNNPLGNRGVPSATRRMHMIQRAAGLCFYQWGCQLSDRIEKLMEHTGVLAMKSNGLQKSNEINRKELKIRDELEDFFDEGVVNDESGEACPPALLFLACLLLCEITSFLREAFQTIPRLRGAKVNISSWEKLMTNRRWSILSNTFSPQQQQQQQQQQVSSSVQSVADINPTIHQGDRRISLSTNEEDSSKESHDTVDESAMHVEKKGATNESRRRRWRLSGSRPISMSDRCRASLDRLFRTPDPHEVRESAMVGRRPKVFRSHTLSTPTVVMSAVSQSARRLAQGRQRLLKRGSPSNPQTSQVADEATRLWSSIKKRKPSRPQTLDDPNHEKSDLMGRAMRKASEVLTQTLSFRIQPMAATSFLSSRAIPFDDGQATGSTSTGAIGPGPKDGLRSTAADDLMAASLTSPDQPNKSSAMSSMHGSTSRPSTSQQHSHSQIEDDELISRNLPWIKTVIAMANSFVLDCTHERFCQQWCLDRIYRQCHRLTEAVRKVHGEDLPEIGSLDKRKAMLDGWNSRQDSKRRSTFRTCTLLPSRRESAVVRQGAMLDKPPMALRSLLIEKLGEIDENKESRAAKASTEDSDDLIEASQLKSQPVAPPILNYIANHVLCIVHAPLSTLLKSCLILNDDHYVDSLRICWHLLTHRDMHVVTCAAAFLIVSSVRQAEKTIEMIRNDLMHQDANVRVEALRRYHALWRSRFHVWLKMEDGAQVVFKVPPPGIDFTLPSPPIGQSQVTVVDSPWMPHIKTKVEELSLKEEEHATSQTIMTMTRTRRKQKQEMVKRAVHDADERESSRRQMFSLRATAIVQQAAYEPALFHHQTSAQQASTDPTGEECDLYPSSSRQQMPVAQPLFPSSLLSVTPLIIEMLDDSQLNSSGTSVADITRKIVWSCIVEDPALFMRHFLEKLTNRDRQSTNVEFKATAQWEYLMSLLRKLILRFQPLPSQTAHVLLNYLFGFVMYYVRSPCKGSDRAITMALSIIWLIAPHVHGLYFKDLKQTLKKEQCDQALMITANVPSAKKIIVHGPDYGSGGIPSQFPIHENTQFQQLLTDSLEFFNIPDLEANDFHLVDSKTDLIHNPSSYIRDFYFFHRSFYPQLNLVKLNPDEAQLRMKTIAFMQKLTEVGKVLLTHNTLKHTPEIVIPQRIFFLHEEFTHLPSFPRKSLETCFGMYHGTMGRELHLMDSMHKFCWALLMSDMFEKMENAFMFGDLHLFINVINGITLLHCEDVTILRRCMATYISMSIHFSTLFANQGFFLIMPTVLRCYSQHQTNKLLCRTIEYVCKQLYILHRKPFLLQMAGSVANIIDMSPDEFEINPMKVKAKHIFALLRSMEDLSNMNDPIDILGLINESNPLKALDSCYRDDPNTFNILTDAMASAVTVCAFAPESRRCYQMLLVMQAILPHYIEHVEAETVRQSNNTAALKHELSIYATLCVEMKALINCCEALARSTTRTFDLVNSVSDRGKSFLADSPQFFDPPTLIEDETKSHFQSSCKEKKSNTGWDGADNLETQREIFRRPRDALLVLAATFIERGGQRLKELAKLTIHVEHVKIPELFDYKCYVKLCEIALALMKIAPYDSSTMACMGLQKYFMTILPVTDWSVESNRSTLNFILRRLDKTIQKIGKKLTLRRRTNWAALTSWLTGLHQTIVAYPYIAHLHPVKTTTQMCLRIMVGDQCMDDGSTNIAFSTVLCGSCPPQAFCNVVLQLASFLMQVLGQNVFSLELLCSTEGIGPNAERLEAVLCHILIPLLLRVTSSKKEAPQFQSKDLIFCLNLMHSAINPPLAKQSLAPATNTNLAASLIRVTNTHDASGRQSSVSVTERGHSATVSTYRIVRETVCQAIFLALKVIVIVFEKQMTTHWTKVSKIVRELLNKKIGGPLLYSFANFIVRLNSPISLIILPMLHNKANQKPSNELEALWQAEFKLRIQRYGAASSEEIISNGIMLDELSQELKTMREDFSTRTFEMARSHTPTIAEPHSDSGSGQSITGHRTSYSRSSTGEPRRSSNSATKPPRPSPMLPHKGEGVVPEGTIAEDTEDDNCAQVLCEALQGKQKKDDRNVSLELHDLPSYSQYSRKNPSLTQRVRHLEQTLALPLNLEEPLAEAEICAPAEYSRSRVVSFNTPLRRDSSDDDDFVDRITARHHYI